jgi:hypothetical protein
MEGDRILSEETSVFEEIFVVFEEIFVEIQRTNGSYITHSIECKKEILVSRFQAQGTFENSVQSEHNVCMCICYQI